MPTEAIAAIYTEIELAQLPDETRSGVVRRRIPSQSPCDLLIGVQKPANVRLLTVRFRASAVPVPYELPEFRSLEMQVQQEMESGAERLSITLRAPQSAWNDIFTSLTEDITRAVGSQTEENTAAQVFQRRLQQWQMLLQKTGVSGLTEERQQGLYGELWCLREIVLPEMQPATSLVAWTGPEAADRDFQFVDGIGVEVKTTRIAAPQTLAISSERQLDDAGLNALYLLHLSAERTQEAGETLPQIIASLHNTLSADPLASSLFAEKLLGAGCLDVHFARYKHTGYRIRDVHLYRVREGFPRITPQDISAGIGSVRYVVSAAACVPFTVDISTLTAQIKGSQ